MKEFSNMLNSYLLTVYDKKKQNQDLNTNHSLVDYYINSSHNTYLKNHQLKGLSDKNVYICSLKWISSSWIRLL